MAYITKKTSGDNVYYFAEESHRVNGKRCRKWQRYLGPIHKIIDAVDGVREKPKYAEIFQLGAPAAYLNIVERMELVNILDKAFKKRKQGLSTGFYLTIAAINRGVRAVSKRSMWDWYKDTIFLRVFPGVSKDALSSQRFWDNMSKITDDKIKKTWMKIVNTILEKENIDLSCLSYDGTNFYTFISSFNMQCSIAKRGKNKQGRRDLKQVSYALFCTRKEHFPIYFDVYDGNKHDSKEFEKVINEFHDNFKDKNLSGKGMTIVFDKGNNSYANFNRFVHGTNFHFVSSVKVDDHKDLSLISNNDKRFEKLSDPRLEEVKAFCVKKEIYGTDMSVIVTFNNKLYTSQCKSINNEIDKCMGKLDNISTKLNERRAGIITKGKKPTQESVKKQVSSILSGQYMKRLIEIEVKIVKKIPELSYWINTDEFQKLADTYLGKNIIITDNHNWSTDEIILTYRSQYIIENIFKQMKDRKTGTWWPMFLWTDQMIRVHGFYCSLAVMIRSLILKRINENGLKLSVNVLHEKLNSIKEVINVFPKGRTTQSVVSKLDGSQKKLFEIFEMDKYLDN
ncbi:MAG: IS1634 family transposase [Desulfobacteraceae bacterium]|nr:IS1634 family transposase [Desulfobacteraceae bacterium]